MPLGRKMDRLCPSLSYLWFLPLTCTLDGMPLTGSEKACFLLIRIAWSESGGTAQPGSMARMQHKLKKRRSMLLTNQ